MEDKMIEREVFVRNCPKCWVELMYATKKSKNGVEKVIKKRKEK